MFLHPVFEEGQWQILEPVMLVEVNAPQEYQGGVMSGLTKRHAIVTGTDANEGYFTIYCEVSRAECTTHDLQTEAVEMVSRFDFEVK